MKAKKVDMKAKKVDMKAKKMDMKNFFTSTHVYFLTIFVKNKYNSTKTNLILPFFDKKIVKKITGKFQENKYPHFTHTYPQDIHRIIHNSKVIHIIHRLST